MATPRYIELPYAETFAEARERLPGRELPWLDSLRTDAIARFRETGLPTPRVEEWKYTNLNPLVKADYHLSQGNIQAGPEVYHDLILPEDAVAYRMVFVNGAYRPDLSEIDALPEGVRLLDLSTALADEPGLVEPHLAQTAALNGHAMVAINTAFMSDGIVLHLAPGTKLERPIHLIFAGVAEKTAAAFHPRILVVSEAGSQATIMESHAGAAGAAYWSNPVTEIVLGEGAVLHHYKVQAESTAANHLALTRARLAANSRYDNFVMSLGGRLSRNEISVVFEGEGAECRLNGGYMMGARQHVDNTTIVDHAVPGCTSREVYKGVLDGNSRGVFQGKIIVRPDAQKTDGHMLNKTLLLSPEAEIDTKPELEIYADDVKCSHGATAGEIDEDSLFYLRARGIGLERARNMLTEAFLQEIVDQIDYAPAQILLHNQVSTWLEAR